MALYKSKVYNRGTVLRPTDQTESGDASMTVRIPSGTTLAAQDVLYFGTLGENIDVVQAHVTADPLDSNATAALAAALGCVPSTTAKTYSAVTGVTGYNSIFTATLISKDAGVGCNVTKAAGGGTAGLFNINPFPVLTVKSDIVMVISAAATTAITNVDRNITVRLKFQMKNFNEQYPSGVTDSTYPLAGAISYGDVIRYDYGGAAP